MSIVGMALNSVCGRYVSEMTAEAAALVAVAAVTAAQGQPLEGSNVSG
eukprot:CAMPEP_0181368236 /NCGR_PEP_ID=MMETSP1106-20121128/11953_1 /TAXON_ID=81844 /ORGANISM="Mantoniella antarctica, Strain SL-175" /LENGTH=47 /DNA_ID= /DNA_START= /DNA_END= /DNA_ORIENTATION=